MHGLYPHLCYRFSPFVPVVRLVLQFGPCSVGVHIHQQIPIGTMLEDMSDCLLDEPFPHEGGDVFNDGLQCVAVGPPFKGLPDCLLDVFAQPHDVSKVSLASGTYPQDNVEGGGGCRSFVFARLAGYV